ncbi:MAG: hypothetical protein M1820_004080 [Bogoriella megaspora]|nr:MAG: hypothetical protein M1820_004080 [Bogoriella megaspora]
MALPMPTPINAGSTETIVMVSTITETPGVALVTPHVSLDEPACPLPSQVPECQSEWDEYDSAILSIASAADSAVYYKRNPASAPTISTHYSQPSVQYTAFSVNSSSLRRPSCSQATIAPSVCSNLQSAFLTSWQGRDDAAKRASTTITASASLSTPWPSSSVLGPGCSVGCAGCAITGGTVRLIYWPVTKTTGPDNGTVTASAFGTVFTSPTVYVSFGGIYASDSCSEIGTAYGSTILALEPGQLSSVWASYPDTMNPQTASFNFTDLMSTPLPASIASRRPQCAVWLSSQFAQAESFSPNTTCPGQYCGEPIRLYDPPYALSAASQAAAPTPSNMIATAAASPASLPQMTQAAPTSKPNALPVSSDLQGSEQSNEGQDPGNSGSSDPSHADPPDPPSSNPSPGSHNSGDPAQGGTHNGGDQPQNDPPAQSHPASDKPGNADPSSPSNAPVAESNNDPTPNSSPDDPSPAAAPANNQPQGGSSPANDEPNTSNPDNAQSGSDPSVQHPNSGPTNNSPANGGDPAANDPSSGTQSSGQGQNSGESNSGASNSGASNSGGPNGGSSSNDESDAQGSAPNSDAGQSAGNGITSILQGNDPSDPSSSNTGAQGSSGGVNSNAHAGSAADPAPGSSGGAGQDDTTTGQGGTSGNSANGETGSASNQANDPTNESGSVSSGTGQDDSTTDPGVASGNSANGNGGSGSSSNQADDPTNESGSGSGGPNSSGGVSTGNPESSNGGETDGETDPGSSNGGGTDPGSSNGGGTDPGSSNGGGNDPGSPNSGANASADQQASNGINGASEIGGHPVVADPANPGGAIIDNQHVAQGQTAVIAGTPISVGPNGVVVSSGPTIALSPSDSDASAVAKVTMGSMAITAFQSAGNAIVGSQTLSLGGPAATISGATFSVGPSGVVVQQSGSVSSAAFSDIAQASGIPSGAVISIGTMPLTAIDSAGTVVLGSKTLSVGGQDVTLLGETISVAPDGIVIGTSGVSSTHAFSSIANAASSGAAAAATEVEASFTVDGHVYTAYEVAGQTGVAVVLGPGGTPITLTEGGPASTISGEVISLGFDGVEIRSGTVTSDAPWKTVTATSLPPEVSSFATKSGSSLGPWETSTSTPAGGLSSSDGGKSVQPNALFVTALGVLLFTTGVCWKL